MIDCGLSLGPTYRMKYGTEADLLCVATKAARFKVFALGALLIVALATQGCATRQQQGLGTAQEYAAYGMQSPYYGVNPYAPFMFGFYDPFWYQWPYYYYPFVAGAPPYRPPRQRPHGAPGPITPRIGSASMPKMPRTVASPAPRIMMRPIGMPMFREGAAMRMGGIDMGGMRR